MLKFLDNRPREKAKKSPIKYKPEMVYGISAESPSNFETPYTIVHPDSYINPYLPFEQSREHKLPLEKTLHIRPSWTRKTNLNLVEEQKILNPDAQPEAESPTSKYRKSYHEQLDENQARFKITRGEFTDFIEKNNRYKSVGPIHGEERTNERIEKTKKSVWFKPDPDCPNGSSKLLYSTYFSKVKQNNSREEPFLRNGSSISINSKLITEKGRIRCNRGKLNASFQKNLEERKHFQPFNVELPKLHSEILAGYRTNKIKTYAVQPRPNDMEDIEQFESKLRRKFK